MSKDRLGELNLTSSGSVLLWQGVRNLPQEDTGSISKYYSKIPSRVFVNNMALVFSRAFLFQPCNSKHILKEQERRGIHESGSESMSDHFCYV